MLKRIGAEEGGEFKAIASGTLPSGKPVIVNADGTVSVPTETTISENIGSATVFESAATDQIASTFDSSNNKVVIAYQDEGNSDHGTAIVGTVSGNSISFGSPVVFNAGGTTQIHSTFDSSNNKVVICYKNDAATENGTAIVGTVSGTSISFGSAAEFETSDAGNQGIIFDSNSNRVVIIYKDGNNSNYGTAIVCTISGTSISFNTPVVFASTNLQRPGVGFDSTNNKIVIAYQDVGNSNKGTAIVGTVSGTSISFGSSVVFDSGALGSTDPAVVYDTNAQKIVIVYQDEYDSYVGSAIVGTVSGTSISFGTAVVFESGTFSNGHACYDTAAQKIVIAYRDHNNSDYGTVIVGTVSGTSISFGSPSVFEAAYTKLCSTVFDSNSNKVVIAYQDNANSSHGTALVYQTAYVDQNLTSENFIGMSRGFAVQTGDAAATGAETVFEQATSPYIKSIYDPDSQKVIIAYQDQGNSGAGTAIVGTVSGTSISFGSPATYHANAENNVLVYDSNSDKVVIAFRDGNQPIPTKAVVGTVSGTSISFGSDVTLDSNYSIINGIAYDSNAQRVVVTYRRQAGTNSTYGHAIVGTVSGTSISFGTPVVVNSASTSDLSAVYDANTQKVVVAYKDGGDSNKGKSKVGTVSGTSISFGSAVIFNNGTTEKCETLYYSPSQKIIIVYKDDGNSSYGTAIVGTVSGTSISFGSESVFESASSEYFGIAYDSNAGKIIIAYRDIGNSNYGNLVVGTVSGTDITFDTPTVFNAANTEYVNATYDTNAQKTVISFSDGGNSSYGTSFTFSPSTLATTRGEVASGNQASMDIIGSVSDNQIGLTAGQQYFVQTDGTIGTTADSPSVLAGTAISATELLVKT